MTRCSSSASRPSSSRLALNYFDLVAHDNFYTTLSEENEKNKKKDGKQCHLETIDFQGFPKRRGRKFHDAAMKRRIREENLEVEGYVRGSFGSYFRRSVTRREGRHGCAFARGGRRDGRSEAYARVRPRTRGGKAR